MFTGLGTDLKEMLLPDGSLHLDSAKAYHLLRWIELSDKTHVDKDNLILSLITELRNIHDRFNKPTRE